MGSEGIPKAVVTQVSFGGFDNQITAKDLLKFLEEEIGLVYRCRLKTSCTPPESFPDFQKTTARINQSTAVKKVEPHAFVHFASPESATVALDVSERCELFFNNQPLKVSLGAETPHHMNQRRRTVIPFRLSDVLVEIGNLVSRDGFSVAWRGPPYGVDFLVDPFDGKCRFCFSKDTAFSIKDTANCAAIKCNYKVEFLVREINGIQKFVDRSGHVLLLRLSSAPWIWYRTADDDIATSVPFDLVDDDDPWIRTTDFTPSGAIGRCNTYRVSIPPRYGLKLDKAITYLTQRMVRGLDLKRMPDIHDEPDFGTHMSDPFFYIPYQEGVPFDVLFLLNAVMHRGIFNQHQISENLIDLLRNQPLEVNVAALKHICAYRKPVFDAYRRLKTVQEWLLKNPKLFKTPKQFDDITEVRRFVITPTKAYCLPPEVELSNRVLRKYKNVSDRFLRVTFMDEGMQTISPIAFNYYVAPIVKQLTSNSFPQKTKVFKRVRTILRDGFYLCSRKYVFLAFSSNQLRDRSAWFFAEDKNTSVKAMRKWMGRFTNRNVAKCAARMGQCFSSTYATVEVPSTEVNHDLEDIKRNSHIFSDGIGMITPDLAQKVAEKLKLDGAPPCAYQIRYAGYKGVVACWPDKGDGFQLSLRPSMNKFESQHTTLEICSWTRFQPGFLNRQIITLLSSLNVPDDIFSTMQETMVSKLNQMLTNTDMAFDVLTSSCSEQGNVAAAIMLSAGFKPQTEPHLRGMLICVRVSQLWGLREKARIFVPSGRWLMGCLDELGELEQGQCFIQVSTPSLENCFSKHGSKFSEKKKNLHVVKGFVVIAKNPCLHPGDIRILEAVDAPGLHHLYDCLIFPQKGDRPHPNEASGSDLDGDLYFVTWDENLIPPSKKSWSPMEYAAPEVQTLKREVNHEDIIEFFSRHIVTESLGPICNAHVVHADLSELGAMDEKCIKLAELASIAVDFPKTGKIVTMPQQLKPKMYPDFMGKEEHQSYKSTKIMGRLYHQIIDNYDEAVVESSGLKCVPKDVPYDKDLFIAGSESFITEAWDQKCAYDGQLNGLLKQYKVQREEEVVTGHIWSMPKHNSRKEGELKEKIKHSYTTLKKEFRQVFEKMGEDFERLSDEDKNSLYEKKASAWYRVTYDPEWLRKSMELSEPDHPDHEGGRVVMLSFAWIAADYLARIKIKSRGKERVDSTKPINSLANYLTGRI